MPGASMDDYGYNVALEYAIRSRERHGVQLDGMCELCDTAWPCEPFRLAHRVVMRLTRADDPPSASPP